jgi:hypothetical protein
VNAHFSFLAASIFPIASVAVVCPSSSALALIIVVRVSQGEEAMERMLPHLTELNFRV